MGNISTTLTCEIVTHPDYPPRRHLTLPIKARVQTRLRSIEERVELFDGSIDIIKYGEPMLDLVLEVPQCALSADDIRLLEEIQARNIPVMVYSGAVGGTLFTASLSSYDSLRNHDYTIENGDWNATSVKLLEVRGDASTGWNLASIPRPVDGTHAIFKRSIAHEDANGFSYDFPLGKAYYAYGNLLNKLVDSTFSDVGAVGTESWVLDAGLTATTAENSWIGESVDTLIIENAGGGAGLPYEVNSILCEDIQAGYNYVAAVGYSSNGTILAEVGWYTAADALISTETIQATTVGSGVGWVTINAPATATKARMVLTQVTGTVATFSCPCLMTSFSAAVDADLSSAGVLLTREALIAQAGGSFLSFNIPETTVTKGTETVTVLYGYGLPNWEVGAGDDETSRNTFLCLENTDIDDTLHCGLYYDGSDNKFFVGADATYEARVLAHSIGDVWFFALHWGHGTTGAEITVYNLTAGTNDSKEITSGVAEIYNKLYIGHMPDHRHAFNGLIGGVNIATIADSDLSNFFDRMTNPDLIDLFAMTNGRYYTIENTLTPSPWERRKYSGNISLKQVGRV